MSQETAELYASHMTSLASQARAAIRDLDPKVGICTTHTHTYIHTYMHALIHVDTDTNTNNFFVYIITFRYYHTNNCDKIRSNTIIEREIIVINNCCPMLLSRLQISNL